MVAAIVCESVVCELVSLLMTVLQLGQFIPQHIEMAVDRSVQGVSPWLLFFNTLYNFLAAVDLLLTSPLTLSSTLHSDSFSLYNYVIDAQPHIQMIGSFVLSFAMWYWYLRYSSDDANSNDNSLPAEHIVTNVATISQPDYSSLNDRRPVAVLVTASVKDTNILQQSSTSTSPTSASLSVVNNTSDDSIIYMDMDINTTSSPVPSTTDKWTNLRPTHVFFLQGLIILTISLVAMCMTSLRAEFAHSCGMLATMVNALMWIPQLTLTLRYGHRGALSLQWVVASFVMDVTYSLYLWAMGVHWSVWANNIPDALFTAILSVVIVRYEARDHAHGLDGFGRVVSENNLVGLHSDDDNNPNGVHRPSELQPLVKV